MDIINKVVAIEKSDCCRQADILFAKASGTDREGPKYERMRKEARKIRDVIEDVIDLKVVFSYYGAVSLDGEKAAVNGTEFRCRAFDQIDPAQVKGAYAYMITAGDFRVEGASVMDQLLAYLWGTSFVDAARACFEKNILREVRLSNAFGPGFYGMDMSQMHDLAELVDGSRIGISTGPGNILIPEKSCAGIYFEVGPDFRKLSRECEDCRGAVSSCGLCNVKNANQKNVNNKSGIFKCTGICSECGRCKDGSMISGTAQRKTGRPDFPADFIPAKRRKGYGLAFDIGTTTVAGMLWDFCEGREKAALAKTNPQNVSGLDVISRIAFIDRDRKNLALMRKIILDCMNEITAELCASAGVSPKAVTRVVVCGNTTMSHIFSGHDPGSLARAPFAPAYTGTLDTDGKNSGLDAADDAAVTLLPNIAGHVGGDIVAGMIASRLPEQKQLTLFADIGTNGEIALADGGRILVCSAAAGPAFEGAAIYQGMRAAPGAIERLRIENDEVLFRTIDDIPPAGICGSGLIDAVAEMLKAGLIDRTGRLISSEDFGKTHGGSVLRERLRTGASGNEFVLVSRAEGEDIVITQKDIREVQLAKGAVAAGISVMLDMTGHKAEEIEKIIVAGAFGNFINMESAVTIGLLPDVGMEKISSAGNTAGTGALMILADPAEEAKARKIPGKAEHVELAECSGFQKRFIRSMSF